MKIKNERGVALVFALMITVVIITLVSAFVFRAIQEKRMSDRERTFTQAFYNAEGGTHQALEQLDTIINTHLLNTVSATNPSTVVSKAQSYTTSGDGIGFLIYFAKDAGTPQLTLNGTQAEYNGTTTNLGAGNYLYSIVVTEKSNPVSVSTDVWEFPFFYKVLTTGTVSGSSNKVLLSGDFTVRVQKDNFAKYALFTNHQTMESGTNVWFTSKTNFAGPMHTNDRYNFAYNPSGTFEGAVKQVQSTARFYNSGSSVLIDANANGTTDVPTFNGGFNRNQSSVTLTSSSDKTAMMSQATGGNTYGSNGIYIPASGSNLSGGIYVKGDAAVVLSVDGSNNAVYTVTQGGTTKTITVNKSANQTTVVTGGTPVTYNGLPDGVDDVGTIVYVDGNISSLRGTVQGDTEATIASENDITISNHLRYQNYTSAVGTPGAAGYVPPHANGQTNLLGLVTWSGDVLVSTGAPNDLDIHATVLAKSGYLQVNNYNDTGVGPRGTATLLGGVLTDYYGAFGLFSGSTGAHISGYGRNFVYDERMATGNAPPYFPSLSTFVAFSNDLTDKLTWQDGGS